MKTDIYEVKIAKANDKFVECAECPIGRTFCLEPTNNVLALVCQYKFFTFDLELCNEDDDTETKQFVICRYNAIQEEEKELEADLAKAREARHDEYHDEEEK